MNVFLIKIVSMFSSFLYSLWIWLRLRHGFLSQPFPFQEFIHSKMRKPPSWTSLDEVHEFWTSLSYETGKWLWADQDNRPFVIGSIGQLYGFFYRYSTDIASSLPCMQREDRQTETCLLLIYKSPAVILRETNISLTRRWALDRFTAALWAMTIWQTSAWSRRETSF